MFRRALALSALLAACGDTPPAGSASDSGSGGSTAAGSSSGQLPTTGPTSSATTGSGSASESNGTGDATGPTSSGPTGTATTDPTTTSTTAASDTTATTEQTSTTAGSTGVVGTSTGSTGPAGCVVPADCPPPPACREALCDAGECLEELLPPGSPCPTGVCDPLGACVECLQPSDCGPGELCAEGQCVPPSCRDGQKNGAETDVDCGGPTCPKCQNGDGCVAASDCVSGVCQAGMCVAAPTCDDALKNGAETDVDCGGPTCPKCQNGDTCVAASDCASNLCQGGLCVAAPTCADALKNGSETDVDCGGATCPKCQNGDSCVAASDCVSNTCTGNVCVPPGPACANNVADPLTGQRCPLFMTCAQSAECGVFQGCQQWFCNNSKKCELNALVDCWTNKGGNCNADVVFTQQDDPPVDKRFLPPDNVDFREVATLAFTVKNNTANDLYLDKLPVTLELMGNASKFDVSSAKIFDNSGGSEHGPGDLLVCLTADPFSFPANGVLGPCGGSAFARVPKGGSNQFLVNLAFAKEKTFIAGRSYRLKLASTAGIVFRVGFNGPNFNGTMCGVPPEGYTGAWVTAQNP